MWWIFVFHVGPLCLMCVVWGLPLTLLHDCGVLPSCGQPHRSFSSQQWLWPSYTFLCGFFSAFSCRKSVLTVFESFSRLLHWCGRHLIVYIGQDEFRILLLYHLPWSPKNLYREGEFKLLVRVHNLLNFWFNINICYWLWLLKIRRKIIPLFILKNILLGSK